MNNWIEKSDVNILTLDTNLAADDNNDDGNKKEDDINYGWGVLLKWWRCWRWRGLSTSSGAAFALQVSIAVWSDTTGICGRSDCLVCANLLQYSLFPHVLSWLELLKYNTHSIIWHYGFSVPSRVTLLLDSFTLESLSSLPCFHIFTEYPSTALQKWPWIWKEHSQGKVHCFTTMKMLKLNSLLWIGKLWTI